ncbi:MAG: phosphotransferase [Oscillospiraceae bacterium]|nr:phosphotransferase [Oscillospiraceae bacterium]
MQTFTLTVLAIYYRNPSAAARRINRLLGVPPRMIRHEREFLRDNGYLDKDRQLNWHVTEAGMQALQAFDREKAKENAAFLKEASETICRALQVEENEISRFTLMDKGMTNDSYVFFCRGKKYIYRHAGQGSDMLVDRYREYANYLALNGLGISDVVVYHNPIDGTKITEFLEDSKGIDHHNPRHIEKALDALRNLHSADIKSPHDFDFLHTIDYYEDICRNAEAEFFSTYRKYKAQVTHLLGLAEKLDFRKCFCHIDFVPGNCLLDKNGKVVLIDWEYSGRQDPVVDVAMFCISAGFTKAQADRLLRLYFQRKPTLEEFARFYTYIATAGLMWSLWSVYKTANGEIFEGYTERTYGLCRKYCRQAQKMFDRIETAKAGGLL